MMQTLFQRMWSVGRWAEAGLFLLALRAALGGLFIYAGLMKMRNPIAFADSIASFEILPTDLINGLALGLPIFELAAGILVIVARPPGLGSLAILLLSVIFAGALAQALLRGIEVDCGCLGGGVPSVGKTLLALARACAIGAAAFWIQRCESK